MAGAQPVFSQEDWAAWEEKATPPSVYAPPQEGALTWKCNPCVCATLRSSCCCCAHCTRCVSRPCTRAQLVRISQPDAWFKRMLGHTDENCPEHLKGIWWMQDNIAAEGLVVLQDGLWVTPRMLVKSARYNWTVDACNCWGVVLSGNFWLMGGTHQMEISPNGKWIHVKVRAPGSHWIYILQEGDNLNRPDGTPVDFTPGEDVLRVSYQERDTSKPISYMYVLRRVAYLDDAGNLVKTKNFDALSKAAGGEAGVLSPHYIQDLQAITFPRLSAPAAAAPPQATMA